MVYKKFAFQTTIRLVFIFIVLTVLAVFVVQKSTLINILLLAALAVGLLLNLIRYVNRTNKNLTGILSGLRFGDYQQSYSMGKLGQTFVDLEFVLHLTVEKVKKLRLANEQQAVYFRSLVEHIPMPMLVLFQDGRVEILNNATRRTFNVADITHVDELENFGASFQRDVGQIASGEQLLTTICIDDTEAQYVLSATRIILGGSMQKLISLQNVQSQLDATELATWQNLLRVTSHEILNSLTPVSSLARTAKSLTNDFQTEHELSGSMQSDLQDVDMALETLVRRSEGLTRFVQDYRQLTRIPPPKLSKITLSVYLTHLQSLLKADWDEQKIRLHIALKPSNISVLADEGLLDQALINLLKNAADALSDTPNPQVWISAFHDGKQRTVLEIADNGPGIDTDMQDKMFVPFFTTKKQGSGVGLTLVRYIVLSHHAAITYRTREGGGAIFRIVF
jgi:two-component system nitrogen regulation sensor histidine kinase NtrY